MVLLPAWGEGQGTEDLLPTLHSRDKGDAILTWDLSLLWGVPHLKPKLNDMQLKCISQGSPKRTNSISIYHVHTCIYIYTRKHMYTDFPASSFSEETSCECRGHGFHPWVGKIPWRRKCQPTPVFCLGNPMDRGAWQAVVHGVARVVHDFVSKP